MKKTVLIFGMLALAILALLQLSQYSLLSGDLKIEFVISGIAIVFFVIGVFIQKKFRKEEAPFVEVDQKQIETIGLSKREYEVLVEMASGYSNKEIADRLFVSESTIKTHVSSVLLKLNAKRRTQAIQKAKELQILPF
ncbi:response regulator transcription factor [Dokdonia pacifica]|uniref:Regulatory protein, luxR family n=1 Tax=Dokdonia pacifica TaxID=1627892 RepID=A0A238WMH7_9FLAO|nr:response regulator transcription factor [Dokdonia pacifica]SNR47503.1 regulatory protein, luxR family [Dokdonia pacifica]